MNEKGKNDYLTQYKKLKEKGVPFFPDILVKDAIVSLLILLVLIGLAYFLGAPLEAQANPADTSYLPRPEWYFRFLFQLLKYFPGNLEVIGVVLIPTIFVVLLFALPFLDRSNARHFSNRKLTVAVTGATLLGIIALSVASYIEAPPPEEVAQGDPVAALYSYNCAGCHGAANNIPPVADLHAVIAQGNHEGMPAWGGDLSSDEIDALAGFILSPTGSEIFYQNCAECHDVTSLVYSNPTLIRDVVNFTAYQEEHSGAEVPFVNQELDLQERASLINFLVAPDGQRLYDSYCSTCHGASISTAVDEDAFKQLVVEGGQHRDMPAWGGQMTENEIEALANYVVSPSPDSEGYTLFQENCTKCHFQNVPQSTSFDEAYDAIANGGSHQQMPVWGDVLSEAQIDALVSFAFSSANTTQADRGQTLFLDNCASCHGEFGEGGTNPTNPADVIAPISSAEYLSTRDDFTISEVIQRGQPNFGMSPFGLSYGGPLDSSDIDLLVDYIRSWEEDPPVDLPPAVQASVVNLDGAEIYQSVCMQCHGETANGGIGPSLRSPAFRSANDQQAIFDSINLGHDSTAMIAWGGILSSEQIQELVNFILSLPETEGEVSGEVSYAAQVKPAFSQYCSGCHDNNFAEGQWNASSYSSVMESGFHAPVIIPGDVENSLLAEYVSAKEMPPSGNIPDNVVNLIIAWINAGAPDN